MDDICRNLISAFGRGYVSYAYARSRILVLSKSHEDTVEALEQLNIERDKLFDNP